MVKEVPSPARALVERPRRSGSNGAKPGDGVAAHSKMAEELNRVNSDLARALAGLQEVGGGITLSQGC